MPARALLHSLHGGAGALFGVLLFVVLFSGTWSLGHEDLRDWLRPVPATAAGTLPVERLLAHAAAAGVDTASVSVLLPGPEHRVFSVCDRQQNCRLHFDPVSGRPLTGAPALDILLNLHKSFFAGFPGRVLVSLFGIALFFLCLSGVLLHGRRWRDLFRLRRDRGLRVALSDLHGLIGLWGLPWLLLFSLTGALSGLGALGTLMLAPVVYPAQPARVFAELMGPPPPAASGVAQATRIDLDRLLARDAVRTPGFSAQRLTLLHAGDRRGSVEIAGIRQGLPSTANFERHLYRLADGAWLGDRSAADRGFWLRAFIAVQPLHFAQYRWLGPGWSSVLRGLQLAMGLGACLLCASGLFLWLQRRDRATGRQTSALRRFTEGVCGGLVAAAAMLLLVLQVTPPDMRAAAWPGLLFGGLWMVVCLAALAGPRDWSLTRLLSGTAGLACLMAAVTHLIPCLARGHWPAAPVDLWLLCGGVLLCRHAWRLASAPAADIRPRLTGDPHA